MAFASNPLTDWLKPRRNAIIGFGAGLAGGQNWGQGVAAGLQGAMDGRQIDSAYEIAEAEKAQRQEEINQTVKFLIDKGRDDLVPLVHARQANAALTEAMKPPKGPESPYEGTGMDAQNANILLTGDPTSPEYAYAYNLATQPKMTLQQTPDGLVPVWETPSLPAGIRPPAGMGQAQITQPASPAIGPSAAPPSLPSTVPMASSGGVTSGNPIPGTMPKPTESQNRIGMLSTSITNEVPVIHANFEALADPKGQLLGMLGPVANPWQSAEYQQAASATAAAASKVLYTLSGAAAGDRETEKIIREITPSFGDKPPVIADKLRRFDSYVRSFAEASGDPRIKELAAQVLSRSNRGPQGPNKPETNKTSTNVTWSVN